MAERLAHVLVHPPVLAAEGAAVGRQQVHEEAVLGHLPLRLGRLAGLVALNEGEGQRGPRRLLPLLVLQEAHQLVHGQGLAGARGLGEGPVDLLPLRQHLVEGLDLLILQGVRLRAVALPEDLAGVAVVHLDVELLQEALQLLEAHLVVLVFVSFPQARVDPVLQLLPLVHGARVVDDLAQPLHPVLGVGGRRGDEVQRAALVLEDDGEAAVLRHVAGELLQALRAVPHTHLLDVLDGEQL